MKLSSVIREADSAEIFKDKLKTNPHSFDWPSAAVDKINAECLDESQFLCLNT